MGRKTKIRKLTKIHKAEVKEDRNPHDKENQGSKCIKLLDDRKKKI